MDTINQEGTRTKKRTDDAVKVSKHPDAYGDLLRIQPRGSLGRGCEGARTQLTQKSGGGRLREVCQGI